MQYTIGQKYTINPHGTDSKWNRHSQKWEPYSGSEAEYVGEIEIDKFKVPVFKFDFYSFDDPTCYVALYNNRWMCGAGSIEKLLIEMKSKVHYKGKGYLKINTKGGPMEIDEFKSQAERAGIEDSKISEFVMNGSFYSTQSQKGEIKYCPSCKVIRQTSCCACGCGSCEKCGHRWTCFLPNVSLDGPVSFDLGELPLYDLTKLLTGASEPPAKLPIELL